MSFVRCLAAVIAATSLVVFVGCSSEKKDDAPPADFCGVAKSSNTTCKEPSDCDKTLAGACAKLDKVVTTTTITAAQGCLESGVCGVASCLSRAQKASTPSDAHKQLAANYCNTCATGQADCETNFYKKGSKAPGLLVLPYTADIVSKVDAECTGSQGCQAKFATCAREVLAREAGNLVDSETASCVVGGFSKDEGEAPVGPDGKPQAVTCTTANCKGCCRDDKCETGDQKNACGANAVACEICSPTASCKAGKCKEPCGPNNCEGCCDGDTCVLGTAKDKCGKNGAKCDSCAGTLVCSKQTCIDSSCQATCQTGCCSATGCKPGTASNACGTNAEACVDCGPGRLCTSAACVLDKTSLWDVYISFAVLPDKDMDGLYWDYPTGAPDPYVIVYTSEGTSTHSAQTTTITDSTIPFWGETPLKGVKASELLNNTSISIYDSDLVYDDYIGGCQLPLTAAIFDGSLQSHVCPASAIGVEVKIYFRINPHVP